MAGLDKILGSIKAESDEAVAQRINDARKRAEEIKKEAEILNKLKDALEFGKGLKMIHQDPFETIMAYVISQNNRVPSIANSLNLIARNYGKKVIFESELKEDMKKIIK